MKKRFIIASLLLALIFPCLVSADLINVTCDGVDGNLVCRDVSGNIIYTIDATNRKLTIPSGSTLEVLGTASIVGDVYLADGKAIKGSDTTAETLKIQAYDVDNTTYRDVLTLTNGNTITAVLGSGNETISVNSADWDISTTGDMTGIGAVTMNGLLTGTLGATVTGATVALNESSNFAVNVGTGTSTGTVTIGGDAAQQIDIGNGAAAKTVTLGSSNTTSTTTLLSGSGAININVSNNQPTNINTGTSTGTTTIGNANSFVTVAGVVTGASPLVFDGNTADVNKTTIAVVDPTAARTITLPDATGTANLNCTATHDYSGGADDWTLSVAEMQCGYITVSNASGAVNALLPSAIPGKTYTITNASGGVLTFKVTGQTGGTIANGKWGFYTTIAADVAEVYELP